MTTVSGPSSFPCTEYSDSPCLNPSSPEPTVVGWLGNVSVVHLYQPNPDRGGHATHLCTGHAHRAGSRTAQSTPGAQKPWYPARQRLSPTPGPSRVESKRRTAKASRASASAAVRDREGIDAVARVDDDRPRDPSAQIDRRAPVRRSGCIRATRRQGNDRDADGEKEKIGRGAQPHRRLVTSAMNRTDGTTIRGARRRSSR